MLHLDKYDSYFIVTLDTKERWDRLKMGVFIHCISHYTKTSGRGQNTTITNLKTQGSQKWCQK